ncbi:MAG: GNAT family N-acetyltransferase [Anaerolineae bacterium]|jgi:GNAT superfamily N-acetyltransferase|nr:GNAT family N-acetyltransferase [Anaerolineae bacterium]
MLSATHIIHNDSAYHIRPATPADIPFLAMIQYEASLPPANFSFWDYPLMGLGIDTLAFIETVMRLNAGTWGSVSEFLVLEADGVPIAAAAGIEADEAFARGPVRISDISRIGLELGWTPETTHIFQTRYENQWQDPQGNFLLLPQSSYIIESVAVIPNMRGKGVIQPLMRYMIDKARADGHEFVGITVANGNDHAKRAYEKLGFQMYLSFGPAFFGQEGFGGYTKYKLPLNAAMYE